MGFSGSGLNLYAYAGNSPTNFKDPSGLQVTATGPTITTPYVGEPSSVEVDQAVAAAEEQMAKAGSGGAQAGLAGFLVALDGFLAYEDYQAIQDFNAENAAYGAEWQSVIAYNQAVLAHPRPLPLAGRYTGGKPPNASGGGDDDDDCKKQWKDAADYCSQLDDIPRDSPRWTRELKQVFGGSISKCMRGQVTERCGGNKAW